MNINEPQINSNEDLQSMNNKGEQYNIDQILETAFDFTGKTEEEKKEMLAEASTMISESTLLKSLSESSEEIQDAFGKMMERDPGEAEMSSFIAANFPNFQSNLLGEIESFLKSEEEDEAENVEV